jgi:SAM-dependent methyltransferase
VNGPEYYAYLTFNSPLSDSRANRIAADLAAGEPQHVVDIGCGWGELLLRVVGRAPGATGEGVDNDERLLERARAAATARGLAERVRFVATVGEANTPAPLVICSGASHVFGTPADALQALYALVAPGGRLLFAEAFWDPSAPQGDDSVPPDLRELPDLPALVELGVAAGLRPMRIHTASTSEWEAFESGFLADLEEWLMTHPDDPEAATIIERADSHRRRWLRGYRNALGYAYLTFGRPSS